MGSDDSVASIFGSDTATESDSIVGSGSVVGSGGGDDDSRSGWSGSTDVMNLQFDALRDDIFHRTIPSFPFAC